jgi:hypothetical protein
LEGHFCCGLFVVGLLKSLVFDLWVWFLLIEEKGRKRRGGGVEVVLPGGTTLTAMTTH